MTLLAKIARLLALAALLPGCSWLFDPAALSNPPPIADAAVAAVDQTVTPPPDASAPRDSTPPVDCAALPLFPGFSDGGATTFDCTACGCLLDDFTVTPGAPRWTSSAQGVWSIAAADGLLTLSTGSPTTAGAQIHSAGHFYLEGDFTLQLEYQIQSWSPGAAAALYALGPASDAGVNVPALAAYVSDATTGENVVAVIDGAPFVLAGGSLLGTLQVSRQKNQLCAAVVGQLAGCRPIVSTARVSVLLAVGEACVACGPFSVIFQKPRVTSGRLVSTP